MVRVGEGESAFARQLGRYLSSARAEVNMSQSAIASELGVDQATVSKVEAGRRRLSVGEFFAWLDLLGLDVDVAVVEVWRQWRGSVGDPKSLWGDA